MLLDLLGINKVIKQMKCRLQKLEKNTISDSRPYKVYTALLTQRETNAPVAIVLENTLGGDIVWSYSGVGEYIGTLTGAFAVDKTGIISASSFSNIIVSAVRGDSNFVIIRTSTNGTLSDTSLNNTIVEIRVYL